MSRFYKVFKLGTQTVTNNVHFNTIHRNLYTCNIQSFKSLNIPFYQSRSLHNFAKCFNYHQPLVILSAQNSTQSRNFSSNSMQGIQENISSLQIKKRPVRKKRTLEDDEPKQPGIYNVVAFATAEEYNLETLVDGLIKQNLYQPKAIDNNSDVVHAIAKYQVGAEPREIFFFREGSVVLWNISELESSNLLTFLKQYEQDSYSERLVQGEVELMNYRHQVEG